MAKDAHVRQELPRIGIKHNTNHLHKCCGVNILHQPGSHHGGHHIGAYSLALAHVVLYLHMRDEAGLGGCG